MTPNACHLARRFRLAVVLFSISHLAFLVAFSLAFLAGSPALAFVPRDGDFLIERSCEARPRLRDGADGPVYHLPPGSVFAAEGLNRADGPYLRVRVPELPERALWIARDCGGFIASPGGRPDAPERVSDAATIFGTLVPLPQLGPFDEAVLALCGPWGARPEPDGFRALFEDPALTKETQSIRAALGSRIRGHEYQDPAAFAEALTQVWFGAGGFAHIFCGEPGPERLGGLHYKGRILEAERAGWIARAPCPIEIIAPPLVSLGIAWRRPDGEDGGEACPKSFSTQLDAAALLVTVTRAFEAKKRHRPGEAMCLTPLGESDAAMAETLAVLVTRDGAVRTFYPSASPRCDGGGPPDNCLCMH
jgi:hypothetical protein